MQTAFVMRELRVTGSNQVLAYLPLRPLRQTCLEDLELLLGFRPQVLDATVGHVQGRRTIGMKSRCSDET
jgi:hypothetical protein